MRKEIEGKVFYGNSKGALVPEELIRPYDLIKNQTVCLCYEKITALRKQMKETKEEVIAAIMDLQQVLADEYKVTLGGKKENVTVSSFDGSVKIVLAVNEYKAFDDRIHMAKRVIDGCIERWSVGTNDNLRALIDQAFALNQSGHMDIPSILALRKLNIVDGEWKKAMDIISDSFQTVASKQYFRVYTRDEEGNYRMLDLDMAII